MELFSQMRRAALRKGGRASGSVATGGDGQPPTQRKRGRTLRLLSYNIQAGIESSRYRHYVTHSWKHFFPYAHRQRNLDSIAEHLHEFDVVGLQEVDAGSLRTGFMNQVRYLAELADFPFWHNQTNRQVGHIARHSNGLLLRARPDAWREYRLPGLPGRGALLARFGYAPDRLAIVVAHLALGRRARGRQVGFLAELLSQYRHAVLMGDFNCDLSSPEIRLLLRSTSLREPPEGLRTFPSWRPRRHLDHILVSDTITLNRMYIPGWAYSDHLPIAAEVELPACLDVHAW